MSIDSSFLQSEESGAIFKAIRQRLLKIAQNDGDYVSAFAALSIHKRSHATDEIPCIYELGLALTLSGTKQVTLGEQVFNYAAGQALLASVDLPVVSQVTSASAADPYLGIMLRLDPAQIIQVAAQLNLPPKPTPKQQIALAHCNIDVFILGAVLRLIELLDQPELLPVLGPLIQQEIIARLLLSPLGSNLQLLNSSSQPGRQIAKSMAWLKVNYAEAIDIESLAEKAHMSSSTFRQHFRNISGLSPLQYIKQLRLQEARQMMLNQGLDSGTTALRVGYESISQFTREYARLFGDPPSRDVKKLRQASLH